MCKTILFDRQKHVHYCYYYCHYWFVFNIPAATRAFGGWELPPSAEARVGDVRQLRKVLLLAFGSK
jgi:hypothetical protein